MAYVTTLAGARSLIDESDGVIFDNDGTLVDSMPVYYRAWRVATSQLGLEFPETKFYAMAGKSPSTVLAVLNKEQGKNVSFDALQTAKMEALKHEFESIGPIQVVVDLVHYAMEKGKRVAVASGGHRTNVLRSLEGIGFEPLKFFHTVVTTEDVSKGKPHPETFYTAAKRIDVDPKRCVGFEDGDLGLEALHAAEMKAVDVRLLPGYPVPEALKSTSK